MIPDLHVDLLDQIVRFRLVVDDSHDQRLQNTAIAVIKPSQRIRFSLLNAAHQLLIADVDSGVRFRLFHGWLLMASIILRATGLFRMLLPRIHYGGGGLWPPI